MVPVEIQNANAQLATSLFGDSRSSIREVTDLADRREIVAGEALAKASIVHDLGEPYIAPAVLWPRSSITG